MAGDACDSRSGSTLLVLLLSEPRFYWQDEGVDKGRETEKKEEMIRIGPTWFRDSSIENCEFFSCSEL